MKSTLRKVILSLIIFCVVVMSCKPKNEDSQLAQNATTEIAASELNQDEENIYEHVSLHK
jgi:hypothetical protein